MNVAEAAAEIVTSVLLHRGGRAPGQVVADALSAAGAPDDLIEYVMRRADELGHFVEIGDDVVLCRRGWQAIAASSPNLWEEDA